MENKIKELIGAMQKLKGEDAEISISHKLYGDQKIRCKFSPVITNEYIGFHVKDHNIHRDINKIKNIELGNNIFFSDDVMEIMIKIK